MTFTHVVPKVQSTVGREEDTEYVAKALLPHSTNETKSIEEKTEMMNGLHFKCPDLSFERGCESTILVNPP